MKPQYNKDEHTILLNTLKLLEEQMLHCFRNDLSDLGEFVHNTCITLVKSYIRANDNKYHIIAWRYICKELTESFFTNIPDRSKDQGS